MVFKYIYMYIYNLYYSYKFYIRKAKLDKSESKFYKVKLHLFTEI